MIQIFLQVFQQKQLTTLEVFYELMELIVSQSIVKLGKLKRQTENRMQLGFEDTVNLYDFLPKLNRYQFQIKYKSIF